MIIITGGAGFIGSNLAAALEPTGAPLIIADRLHDGAKWRNIAKRLLHDIVPPEALLDTIHAHAGQLTALFHMGAISSTTASDADLVIDTNFRLSVALWQACARHGIPFIYASSAATYGDGQAGFEDSNDIEKLRLLHPLNLYGWSKWLFDAWVLRSIARGDPAPPAWTGLRFFNVFGPNEYHKAEMRSLVAKIIAAHRPGAPVRLFKSCRPNIPHGGQRRDFIAVDDAVKIILWLHHTQKTAGILNIGTGTARTFEDLATATIRATGQDPIIEYIDMPDSIRESYQYYTCADMARLRRLGYDQPFQPLETSVTAYVQSYLLADDPYK